MELAPTNPIKREGDDVRQIVMVPHMNMSTRVGALRSSERFGGIPSGSPPEGWMWQHRLQGPVVAPQRPQGVSSV